jgi:hypothetical protein
MWPSATYCGPGGIACAEATYAPLALGPADLHAPDHEVRHQHRDEVRAGAGHERSVERRAEPGDPIRVLAVPLAGVPHEVDDPAFAEERQTADERGHAELVGAEDAALLGPADAADQMDAAALPADQRRDRVEQLGGVVVAGDRDDRPALGELQEAAEAERERIDGGDRAVEHVAGDEDEVYLKLVGDPGDLVQGGRRLGGTFVPPQTAADVPIGGMEDPHQSGGATLTSVRRTGRRRRPPPLPSGWPRAGTGT